jgi:hypothetical protein
LAIASSERLVVFKTKHVENLYREAFLKHGDTPHSVFWPRGRQNERWETLTRDLSKYTSGDLLDYGCGLAHMRPWLDTAFPRLTYFGADLVQEFVEACREKYPNTTFYQASDPIQIPRMFDYTVASGTFNIRYAEERNHWSIVRELIRHLWAKTNRSMALDFMHTMVDYRQTNAYHQDIKMLVEFLREEISSSVKLDFTHLPYEVVALIHRD